MPSGGANKRSFEEHRKAGTVRKGMKPEPPAIPAADYSAPSSLSPKLKEAWGHTIDDLKVLGVITRTDLDRLARAYRCLANADKMQGTLDAALSTFNPSAVSRIQSALASSMKTADSLIASIERAVRLRPKPESKADEWES
jgi:phage terminase small subunit